jgi:hypothetical protein
MGVMWECGRLRYLLTVATNQLDHKHTHATKFACLLHFFVEVGKHILLLLQGPSTDKNWHRELCELYGKAGQSAKHRFQGLAVQRRFVE